MTKRVCRVHMYYRYIILTMLPENAFIRAVHGTIFRAFEVTGEIDRIGQGA